MGSHTIFLPTRIKIRTAITSDERSRISTRFLVSVATINASYKDVRARCRGNNLGRPSHWFQIVCHLGAIIPEGIPFS
jgi:hypothetical protein